MIEEAVKKKTNDAFALINKLKTYRVSNTIVKSLRIDEEVVLDPETINEHAHQYFLANSCGIGLQTT